VCVYAVCAVAVGAVAETTGGWLWNWGVCVCPCTVLNCVRTGGLFHSHHIHYSDLGTTH
jgi:hypothetical protein